MQMWTTKESLSVSLSTAAELREIQTQHPCTEQLYAYILSKHVVHLNN